MSNQSILKPVGLKIATGAVVTTTTSYTFTAPVADSYTIYLVTGTGTGTSPTLDVSLQHTPDGGTTWLIAPIRFAQQTTTGLNTMMIFRIRLGENEVALNQAVAATGGTLAKNFTPSSMSWRLTATIGGTNPSYATIDAWLHCMPVK
jgi:hypothetical protein